jgi:Xaa-Pro aminopeptidase
MSENEADGIHAYIHRRYGAEGEGYPPIVGAGANGCILHYGENNSSKIDNQLLLMDVGSEYHGYSADVTRTIPANGKFTEEQKAIYQLVYDAQEAIFTICKEGTPLVDLNNKAKEVLAKGLLKLGIIKDSNDVKIYYPHGCSHFLGLDVHDKGNFKGPQSLLKENMIITVEPGIYIPANSNCDKKWWNIGVRIEDDILIKKDSYENLSADSPRKWNEIEALAKQKSTFNEMKFPKI